MEVILLSFCLSLDSFIVGINFGISKTAVSKGAKLIMLLASFAFTLASMLLGFIANFYLPLFVSKLFGLLIFVIIGFLTILKTVLGKSKTDKEKTIFSFGLKTIGITIRIINNPEECDFDSSKVISSFEAVFLSLALSADSVTIGFGSGILGIFNLLLPLFVSVFSVIFITLGQVFTAKYIDKIKTDKKESIKEKIGIVSGAALIIIGIVKFWL